MLGGSLLGKKAQSSAQKRSPEEQLALQGASSAGTNLLQQGQQLGQMGTGAVTPALSYYQALLGGDRAKMAQATAGTRAALTDTYRGAERGVERSGLQGAARDRAQAELNRDRAGAIARTTTGVQPGAAAALSDMGTNLIGQGGTQVGNAGSIYRALLGEGADNRYYARQEGEKAGTSIGGLLFDILSGGLGKFGKGGAGMPGIPGGSRGPF